MRRRAFRHYIYQSTRMPYSNLFLGLFLLGFLLGIVTANLVWSLNHSEITALDVLRIGRESGVSEAEFQSLFMKRMKTSVLLVVLGLTSCGVSLACIGLLWYGFLGGILCTAVVLQQGLYGLLLVFLGLLLPMICYVPSVVLLLNQVAFLSQNRHRGEEEGFKEYGRYLGLCFLLLVLYGGGIWLEAYVAPRILGFFGG